MRRARRRPRLRTPFSRTRPGERDRGRWERGGGNETEAGGPRPRPGGRDRGRGTEAGRERDRGRGAETEAGGPRPRPGGRDRGRAGRDRGTEAEAGGPRRGVFGLGRSVPVAGHGRSVPVAGLGFGPGLGQVAAGNVTSNAAPPCCRLAASIDPPSPSTIV